MKRIKLLVAFILSVVLLSGCTGKFSPKETAVRIGKDGTITAAVIDELDQSYYKEDELETTVKQAVADYNADAGEDKITIETFNIKERSVSLFIKYASSEDYEAFNNVTFFAGDIVNADQAGYEFDASFIGITKGKITNENADQKEVIGENYNVLILEESMSVEVPGNIVFVSSNVEVTGKRKAAVKAERTDSEEETQADSGSETEIEAIKPVEELEKETQESKAAIAYIIYK